MSRIAASVSALLAGVLLTAMPATTLAGDTKAAEPLIVYEGKTAIESRDFLTELSTRRPLTANEEFYLGASLFANRQFNEAILTASQAMGLTPEPRLKAALYVLVSESHAALGHFDEAAKAAKAGQRLDPNSKELAALRIAYFDKTGNQAEKQAATDHLRKLDPNFDRNPVMEPITGAAVVATVVIIIEVTKLLNDNCEHFHQLVMNIVKTWNDANREIERGKAAYVQSGVRQG